MTEAGPAIPASVEAAWGLRDRPARGPKPALTLDRIVSTAVALADAEGLDAVSMSRVAKAAGASTMALYRYVASKAELIALMVDHGLGPFPQQEGEAADWRAALERWTWGAYRAYLAHPWAVRAPIQGPPITPNQITWLEGGLRALAGTSLTEQEKASTILMLSGLARDRASLIVDFTEAAREGIDVAAAAADYAGALRRLADPQHFPAVYAALDGGAFDDEGDEEDFGHAELGFGLQRALDGIAALIEQRARH